ncbi:CAPN3 [Symbiodinium microadriaticum]|nr:CAPN3 [Symbiodinium microadriaticum]
MASTAEIPHAVVLSGPQFYQPHITALYGGYKRTENLFQKATYQKDPLQREGIQDQMSYLYFSLADGRWCVGTKLGATIAELPEAGCSCPPVLIYQAAGTDPEQAFPNLRGYVSWAANLTGKPGYFAFDHLIVLEALFLPEEAADQSSEGAFMHILVQRYVDYEFPPSAVSLLGEPPALKPRRSARAAWRPGAALAGLQRSLQVFDRETEPGATRDWVGLASTAPTDVSFSRSVLAAVREYPAHVEGLLRSGPLLTDGKYCVCLFDVWEKEWRELCVDDFVPTMREPQASAPTHWAGGSLRPFWVMLLEKALAKLCGSYEALECSHPGGLLAALTGQTEGLLHWEKTNGWWAAWRHAFPIVDRSVRMPSPSPCLHRRASARRPLKFQLQRVGGTWHRGDEFLAELRELHDKNALLLAWIFPGERADATPPRADGLAEGHGYSIVNFLVEKDVQLVQLRNLWGSAWKGAWSDDSREWLDNPQIRRHHFRPDHRATGRFWMSWADFSLIFDAVETCPMVSAVRKAPEIKAETAMQATAGCRWLIGYLWVPEKRHDLQSAAVCWAELEAEDAEDALNFFALRRTDLEKKRLSKVQGVETPSQVRYVGYVDRLLREQMAYLPSLVSMPRLEEVLLASVQATKFFTEQFEMLHRGHHLVAVVQDASTGRSIASALGQNDGDAKIWHFGEARLSGDVGLIVYTCHPDGLPVDKEQASALISEGAWQGSGKRKLKEAFGCFFHVNFLDGDVLEIPATETDQACKRPELFCPKGVLNLVCKRA